MNPRELHVAAELPGAVVQSQDARMPAPSRHLPHAVALLTLLVGGVGILPVPQARAADEVTIYRCTNAKGHLTLRDSPCAKGERQQTRQMLRPKDAPPRTADTPTVAPTYSSTAPQVLVIREPRPLYECVTSDNARYLSDTPEGNPRLVPSWTLGDPVIAPVTVHEPGRVDFIVENGRVSGNYRSGSFSTRWYPTYAGYGAQTWVRDTCFALPQADVCARLHDRRDEVRRRFFNAQPTERAQLSREERSINARLAQDCG